MLYLSFTIKGPIDGGEEPKQLKADIYCIEPNLHGVVYSASRPGQYLVTIKWNGRDVHGSPFAANIRVLNEENSSDENNDIDKVVESSKRQKTVGAALY